MKHKLIHENDLKIKVDFQKNFEVFSSGEAKCNIQILFLNR